MNDLELQNGDKYFKALQLWTAGIVSARNGYLLMGKSISLLRAGDLWRNEGTHVVSWKMFVDKVLHISVSQAARLIQIYDLLGGILERIDIDISKVTLLLPYLADKTEEQRIEMLNSAKDCTVEAIRDNIKDMEGNPETATDRCEHPEIEQVSRCRLCGKWLK